MKSLKDFGLELNNNNFPITEYDINGNIIHYKNSDGYEWWKEYDTNGNEIHYKDSDGDEWWSEYDANGNVTHFKNSHGKEWWKIKEGKLTLKDGIYTLNGEVVNYINK